MITPVSPTTEPIERSMPPVMITKAMPTAKIPSMEIWRVVLTTFEALKKSEFDVHSAMHISTSASNMPSSRLMTTPLRLGPPGDHPERALDPSSDRQLPLA